MRLFVVKEAYVGGRVHCIIGPTDFQDAWGTTYTPFDDVHPAWMRDKILCEDNMSGPSSLASQREEA